MSLIGLELATYRAGTIASPVYTDPIGVIKSETLNLAKATADDTDRRSNGWRLLRSTLKEGSLDIQVTMDPDDADFIELERVFEEDDQIVLFVANGIVPADPPAVGEDDSETKGLLAAWEIETFNTTRDPEGLVVVDMKLNPVLEKTTASAPRFHTAIVPAAT